MTVKSMLVKIGVDTKGLESGFKKADGYMQSHSAQFKKAGMAMTAVGAAVVGSIGLMVKGYVTAGDEVHKMALRTGFGTEALSELKYAAEISGADINALEKGVKRMSKTIVDASEGMATYIRSFERIGIEAEELIGLSPEQQFDKIATAIASVEDPTIRAATAQDIFGRAGTQLLPLFAAGADGLEELRQKARDMGIVFDQEAANKAANLQDAMTTLKGSFKGVTNTIAETLVPIITKVVKKISDIVIKVKEWMKEHPKLAGTITKVALVVGGLMAVLGPLVMILPALVSGIGLLGGAFSAMLGPIGLVIAAVAVGVTLFLKLKSAQDAVRKSTERLEETETHLKEKLLTIAKAAGLTGEEFGQLTKKYKGNWIQMALAIKHGEEGIEMQQAMTEEGKKRVEQQEAEKAATIDVVGAMDAYNQKMQETSAIVQTMTDEINKATMGELEYAKWALEQKYIARQEEIEKEIEAGLVGNEALKLMEEAKIAEMAAIDEEGKAAAEERATAHAEKVKEVWNAFWADAQAQLKAYLTAKQELTDSINKLTMDELEYTMWALDEDYKTRQQHIKDTIKAETEKDELLKLLHEKYLLEKEKAQQDHDAKMTELQKSTLGVLTGLYMGFCEDILTAFEDWGAGTTNIMEAVGEVFKNLVTDMIGGLKKLIVQELATAAKTVLAEKAKAIAKVIVSVMAAIPFPLNLVLVGGAIAAVSALFRAIGLGEGGIIARPTPVVAGERGPEIYMPLNKFLSTLSPAGAGAITVRQTNYFYGNINNAGDLDEISHRLAQKTQRMIERGRRP